jgi:HD-GYP domain-containing protein (c-di-GMP phosphodiesterase class II)
MNKPRRQAIGEAKDIINRLAIAIKIAQTYSMDNEVVVKAIDSLVALLKPLLQAGDRLEIELLGEYFYLNEARVRFNAQYYMNFDFLVNEFRKRDLGKIVFENDITKNDIHDLIVAFITCLAEDMPYMALRGSVDLIESVEVGVLKQARQDNLTDVRRMVKKSYFNAVSNLRALITKARHGMNVDVRRTTLAMHSLVDLMLSEEQMLINMTAIKDYDEYTYYHSVNVSILSIAIGLRLGLSRKRLSELGISAMLHDVGKLNIPDNVLNKETPFTDEEWRLIRSHPTEGVKAILGSIKMDTVSLRSAIVSFEHHLNYDGSGYPPVHDFGKLDLFSNIITIADRFDAMTSARVYARIPKPPEEAVQILADSAGRDVDPELMKIFARMTGRYPIGSMVLLDTREMGIVFLGNSDLPDRPIVNLLFDSQGNRVSNIMVDLSEKGEGGAYLRTVKKTVDPFKYGINISEYLLDTADVSD